MRIRARTALPVLLAAALLAGCGGSSPSTTPSTPVVGGVGTDTNGKVGGMATCDQASLAQVVEGMSTDQKTPMTMNDHRCADGWAVADVTVGSGDSAFDETVIFEAEGQFWVPMDRAKVCASPSPVPKALYQQACQSN